MPAFTFGRELDDDAPVPADAYVVGEQPWWELAQWPAIVAANKSLRAQLRRAQTKGVVAERVGASALAPGTELRRRADLLVQGWLRTRHMAPMSYAAAVEPFADLPTRAFVVAQLGDDVVGLVSARPVGANVSEPFSGSSSSWLLEHVLRKRDAPNGTAELLVDAAFTALKNDGATHATLGLAPLFGRVPRALDIVRRSTRGLFDFQGLADFKKKLKPKHWRRVLVEHPHQGPVLGTLRALRAFAGGSLVSFGLKSALRGPPPLLRAVAALLVPWVIGLALIDSRFFPSRTLQHAWVAFDVALVPALFWLARRVTRRARRRWLHFLLAGALSCDAVVTIFEALLWNGPRLLGGLDVALVGIACLGPSLVAVVLWSSLRHR